MSTFDLKKQSFILGVEETWDTYYEVPVSFNELVLRDDSAYYLFSDNSMKKFYYLKPRYVGEQIEDVLVRKQIVVNIYKQDPDANQKVGGAPVAYATGLLKLRID